MGRLEGVYWLVFLAVGLLKLRSVRSSSHGFSGIGTCCTLGSRAMVTDARRGQRGAWFTEAWLEEVRGEDGMVQKLDYRRGALLPGMRDTP